MDVRQMITEARDMITVKRVFGDPYEKGDLTIIPAATVRGGAGGGGGEGPDAQGKGEGGGFGVSARPCGAYVIRNGEVTWRPAVDVNRVVPIVGAVVIVAFLAIRSLGKARAKAELIGKLREPSRDS